MYIINFGLLLMNSLDPIEEKTHIEEGIRLYIMLCTI